MTRQTSLRGLCTTIKDLVQKGDTSRDKAEEFYAKAGEHLAELKERKPGNAPWYSYVKEHCGLSQSRADQLIRIATGKTTVKKVREQVAASAKKRRKRKKKKPAIRIAGSSDACDEIDYPAAPDTTMQSVFNVRYLAGEAIGYCQRAAVEIETVTTVTPQLIAAVRDAADAWTALAKSLEQRTGGRNAKAS